jgi:hypothetical protein
MEPLLEKFEYLPDAVTEIESLIENANRTRGQKEKRSLLIKAQELADAYDRHSGRKLFNQIYKP